MSIRSAADEYEFSDLPAKEQELIREYLSNTIPVNYKSAYDCKPQLSKYADLATTATIKETVVEYLTNYLYTTPGDYPFDPLFGCRLKYHLKSRDTQLRKLLISNEVRQIVNVISSDLGLPIIINGISINPMSTTLETSYNCIIDISIPGEENVVINVSSFYNY